MPEDELYLRRRICEIGKLLYDKGLIAGCEGNISVRFGNEHILITPAGACKGRMSFADIVKIPLHPNSSADFERASSEVRLHLSVYRRRGEFGAAVHVHSPFATGFAVAGEQIDVDRIPEFQQLFGTIPLVPFAPPGSQQLADAVTSRSDRNHTFLLERHGVIAFGTNLDEAHLRAEMAERCAKTLLFARILRSGGRKPG